MALNTVYLPKVDGLQTETSNINSDPRSLADCTDVIANREDFLESRHGHPSAPKGTSVSGTAVDLYAYRNETQRVFVCSYKVSGKYQFKVIAQTGDEISLSSVENPLRDIDGISSIRSKQVNVKPTAFAHDDRLLFLTDYGVYHRPYDGFFSMTATTPIKVEFPVVRSVTVSPVWAPSSFYDNSDLRAENAHWLVPGYQVDIKIVVEIEAKNNNVGLIKGERRLASPPSRIYSVKNFNIANNATASRTSNMRVDITSLVLSNFPTNASGGAPLYVKIYRTRQFQIGTAPSLEYYLAIAERQVISTDPPQSFILTANDDIVTTLEPLYNDVTQGGTAVTNHHPIPAKNVTQFKNYYVYSNIAIPTLTQLGIREMPADLDTLTIKISGSSGVTDRTHQITFKSSGASSTVTSAPTSTGQVNIPTNRTSLSSAYIADENDLTFSGPRATQALDVNIAIVPGTAQGQVSPYGKITKVEYVGTSTNATVKVTPDSTGFDINRFNQPGVAALVNGEGQISVLFSYKNVTALNAGTVDFEGSVSVGDVMPSNRGGTITVQSYSITSSIATITTAANHGLYSGDSVTITGTTGGSSSYFNGNTFYPIAVTGLTTFQFFVPGSPPNTGGTVVSPGAVTLNMFVYAINVENLETTIANGVGVNATVSNLDLYKGGSTYLSLLPCNNGLPFAIAKPSAVDNRIFKTFIYEPLTGARSLQVNPNYVGLLTKPQGQLFDELSIAIADNIQNGINQGASIISLSGGDQAESGIVTAEILDYRYEKIEFIRTGSVSAYEPPVTTSYTIFVQSETSVSSFIISKENNPELIPYSGVKTPNVAGPYVPPRIGNANKAIVACAATKDSFYLLKEDCIARVFIGSGTLIPIIDGINIFDNTTFCVSAGSVQVLDDSVLFLAQNGVHAITGNNISKISRQIETELKKAISQCRAVSRLDDIRSFANSAKGLYGLHIPTGVTSYVTYVLNIQTMRWVKWSNTFNGAVVDQDGRLTTLMTDDSGNYVRQDRYTNGDPRAEVDQIDDEFVLTGATNFDADFVRTITQTGLGDKSYRLGSKQVYYKAGSTIYPVTLVRTNANTVTVTFLTLPAAFSTSDSIVVGVNMMLEFQPFTNNNPSTLKMFSGFHTHTEESVLDLSVSFRTEARDTFSVVKTFSVSPDNRTVYRCYIPLEATRGRFLYRKITHTRPYQICAIPAQAIVHRETNSERVNK